MDKGIKIAEGKIKYNHITVTFERDASLRATEVWISAESPNGEAKLMKLYVSDNGMFHLPPMPTEQEVICGNIGCDCSYSKKVILTGG